MNDFSRREFIQTSSILLVGTLMTSAFDVKRYQPRLAFSTLGCPDWNFNKIVDFAARSGYQGIELRGILRELDLTKCNEFNSAKNISATNKLMKENDLRFVDLGSSANLHIADPEKRQKNLDEAKRFIDLAQQINCPNIRVFPNSFPKDQEKNATMDLISKGLLELADYAKGTDISVLIETHGDFVNTEDILKVMQSAEHKHAGLVWDVTNMWTLTKEPPAEVYKKIKKYIRHTHIKDAKIIDGKIQYTFLGQGEVPIFEAIDTLAKHGYKGYYSFEWEKLWHPEIGDPEAAFMAYIKVMKQHFNQS